MIKEDKKLFKEFEYWLFDVRVKEIDPKDKRTYIELLKENLTLTFLWDNNCLTTKGKKLRLLFFNKYLKSDNK